MEAGGSDAQGHPWLLSEFEASLRCVRPSLEKEFWRLETQPCRGSQPHVTLASEGPSASGLSAGAAAPAVQAPGPDRGLLWEEAGVSHLYSAPHSPTQRSIFFSLIFAGLGVRPRRCRWLCS